MNDVIVGRYLERDAEGYIIHQKNKPPTKKERFVRNTRTKSGNIIR